MDLSTRIAFCIGALLLGVSSPLKANDPGGGTNGVGPNVTLTDNGSYVTLANGILTARITKSSAQVTSMGFLGKEMVVGNIYFSQDGGASYENPANGSYWIKTNASDRVDAGFRCTMTNDHWFNVDIHYVLARGDSGLYAYAVLSHPASFPVTGYGEWRMVWKMTQDQTERIYVDEIRNWQQPSAADLAAAQATGIAEIVKLTTGPWAGRYDCKYMYSCEYQKVGCYGRASNVNKIGAWLVFGGYDFFNDGPTKQDLAPASGINHVHFGRNHYNGSGLTIANGEVWSKCFGPYLIYCNTNAAGGDACWADARAQVQAEIGAWPYPWLTGETNYPLANERGAVAGALVFSDALKAGVSAAGAWVGLADPSVADWQFDSKFYQYWVRADPNGNFVIPHARPGSYTLHAFNDGAVAEFSQSAVTVAAGTTNALGTLTWNVPHAGGYLAWEIGRPDRLATDFRHGTNYWEPYLWDSFDEEFSNPIQFNLDAGNPAWDLNYAHNFYGTNVAVWSWNINFTLPAEPPNSNARLTLATAGGEQAHLYVYVNGSQRGNFYPANADGNSLLRQGVHDKYGVNYVTFNASTFLNAGTNTIVLQQVNSTPATGNHTMYDYLALEMPGSAPAVQYLLWTGGTAGNTWDSGTTTNWSAYAQPKTFSNGSKVLFNDTGSNSPPVNLAGTLTPATVVVNATKDYTLAGTGSLAGTLTLTKKGPATLTLTAGNTFTGDTIVESGTLRAGNAVNNLSPSSRVWLNPGAKLDLNGVSQTIGPLGDRTSPGGLVTNGGATPITLTLHCAGGSNNFSGTITDGGAVRALSLVKSGAGTQTLSGTGNLHGSLSVSNGTLALANAFSVAACPALTVHTGAKLDVTARTGGSLALTTGQTLNGNGAVVGDLTVGSGATLAPGLSLGTLYFSNALTLLSVSTTLVEVNRNTATNDLVAVTGALNLGGTLRVTNLAGTLVAGDNFKLFNAATFGGSFNTLDLPPLSSGRLWNASQLESQGRLWVVSAAPPVIAAASATGGSLTFSGTGGTPGWEYYVLRSTNLALPLAQWTRIRTNQFDAGGSFIFMEARDSAAAQLYYSLQLP